MREESSSLHWERLRTRLLSFQLDTVIPFTFPTVDSYLRLSSVTGTRLRIGFNFRSYNRGGLLFVHELSPYGRAMVSWRAPTEGVRVVHGCSAAN